MRHPTLLLILLLVIACSKDNNLDPISGDGALHYDRENQSAPAIARGLSYAAVRFPPNEITSASAQGKQLTSVDFYVSDRPTQIRVLLFNWNDQTPNEPGTVLYEQILQRGAIDGNAWNRHNLGSTVSIPTEGFWIACEVDAGDQDLRVIGCDPGPRHPEGDVYGVFGDNLPGWTSLYDFSSQAVNVNWNIRARIE